MKMKKKFMYYYRPPMAWQETEAVVTGHRCRGDRKIQQEIN